VLISFCIVIQVVINVLLARMCMLNARSASDLATSMQELCKLIKLLNAEMEARDARRYQQAK